MSKKRHFSQEEKYATLMSAKDIGVDKSAEIAGLHYTTVYGWRGNLAAIGKKAFFQDLAASTLPRFHSFSTLLQPNQVYSD